MGVQHAAAPLSRTLRDVVVQAVVKLRDEGMGHGSEEELPSAVRAL